MILGVVRRILKEDLAKVEKVPAWLDALLSPLNQFIDSVALALRNNLSFEDNFSCEQKVQTFTHNVELSVLVPPTRRVIGAIPLFASGGNIVTGVGLNVKGNGQLGVKVHFAAGGSTRADVTLVIFLK